MLCLACEPSTHDVATDVYMQEPYEVVQSSSALVQSRVEFVELGRGRCSNFPGWVPAVAGDITERS